MDGWMDGRMIINQSLLCFDEKYKKKTSHDWLEIDRFSMVYKFKTNFQQVVATLYGRWWDDWDEWGGWQFFSHTMLDVQHSSANQTSALPRWRPAFGGFRWQMLLACHMSPPHLQATSQVWLWDGAA